MHGDVTAGDAQEYDADTPNSVWCRSTPMNEVVGMATWRPERKLVSEEKLIEILNLELGVRDECRTCYFVGPVSTPPKPYKDGGNWVRRLSMKSESTDPKKCASTAADIISSVSARYNLG
jgi:hypothetical protein